VKIVVKFDVNSTVDLFVVIKVIFCIVGDMLTLNPAESDFRHLVANNISFLY
jgi:hypothetical protein